MSDEQNRSPEESSGSPSPRKKPHTSSNGSSKRTVSIVAMNKGGVGKSFVASAIVQAYQEAGEPVVALDTDPLNQTLCRVKSLGAEYVEWFTDDHQINVETLNAGFSRLITEDKNFVIDLGAASFLPLCDYLMVTGLLEAIAEHGKRIVVHSVVVGGSALEHTALAALGMVEQFPRCVDHVLWLNPCPSYGPVAAPDGTPFEDLGVYEKLADRVLSVIKVPQPDGRFVAPTLAKLLASCKTFADARRDDSGFDLISRLWLDRLWLPLRAQIAEVV